MLPSYKLNSLYWTKVSITCAIATFSFKYARNSTRNHANLLNSYVSVLYTNLRTYRTSLHSFRVTLLSSTSMMTEGFLPQALIPRPFLQDVLHHVLLQATPSNYKSSLFETKLVSQFLSTDFSLLFTFFIPFSSKSTVLDISMPSSSQCPLMIL